MVVVVLEVDLVVFQLVEVVLLVDQVVVVVFEVLLETWKVVVVDELVFHDVLVDAEVFQVVV